jgi:hypothetical protein
VCTTPLTKCPPKAQPRPSLTVMCKCFATHESTSLGAAAVAAVESTCTSSATANVPTSDVTSRHSFHVRKHDESASPLAAVSASSPSDFESAPVLVVDEEWLALASRTVRLDKLPTAVRTTHEEEEDEEEEEGG